MQQNLFNNNTGENIKEFQTVDQNSQLRSGLWSKNTDNLWNVDDRTADNPTLRFQRSQNSFAELIYDNGSGSVMGIDGAPDGMVAFIEKRFLEPLRIGHSKFVSVRDAADRALTYLDWQEPYFFLVDMPISLTQDNYRYTYRNKKTGSILSPDNIETFQIHRGWKFPHYTHVHKIMMDPRTEAIARGQRVMMPDNSRPMVLMDVLSHIAQAVYGSMSYLESCVMEWSTGHYADICYDARTGSPEDIAEIERAEEFDQLFWTVVVIGVFTWLKSPYGLKFLARYHPIYYELLDWDTERDVPLVADGTGGWCIVDSWSIYTGRDIERLETVKPGTCCVSNQQLHCTQRVNARAVLKPCYCGLPRSMDNDDYWIDRHKHTTKDCRRWEEENPPQMVFVSYAAMYNILNKMDPNTRCQRHSCPNTTCSYHAGNYARIRALTERRTKMLTSSNAH